MGEYDNVRTTKTLLQIPEDVEFSGPVVRPILEPLPKWDLVLEIMQVSFPPLLMTESTKVTSGNSHLLQSTWLCSKELFAHKASHWAQHSDEHM